LNRLLVLGVMAALVTVVHRSDSSVRLQYGRVRTVQRSAPRARARYICRYVVRHIIIRSM
jgi:hypothetical protein